MLLCAQSFLALEPGPGGRGMSTIPRVLHWAVEGEAPQGMRVGGCRPFLRSWKTGGEEGTFTHKSKKDPGNDPQLPEGLPGGRRAGFFQVHRSDRRNVLRAPAAHSSIPGRLESQVTVHRRLRSAAAGFEVTNSPLRAASWVSAWTGGWALFVL